MRCRACQTENLADAAFCEECAAPLEATFASCSSGNPCMGFLPHFDPA